MAVYYATKAYVVSFSEALAEYKMPPFLRFAVLNRCLRPLRSRGEV